MANILALDKLIKLDRDARQTKTSLSKWFNELWTIIQPFLDHIVFEDTQRN
jgi:hypothetical protein